MVLYNYKYNGKELQETGFYDYDGWRQYMPDLGRWNGMDQLSENYLSTSPYAYVANNSVKYADIDGRWFAEDGSIINTSGQTYGFLGSSMKPSYATNYLGQGLGDTRGYTPFGETKAYSMLMDALQNNKPFSINNGYMSYWTNMETTGIAGDIQGLLGHTTKLEFSTEDWYGSAGKGNWYFGTSSILTGFAGIVQSRQLYKQGVRRGISSNYTLTGRNLSQFGKAAMTDATVPISKIGRVGKGLGTGSFYLGVAFDAMGVINGDVSLGKALLNTGFGIAGNWGGSVGASVGTLYFGVDNFYNGAGGTGWPGFFNDANTDQRMIDEGFNQAGPYGFHIMGAHEPK
ncbi:RHS repeat-associated core domain-containing protein [Chryseobacterium polytrichastri]|uniref:RHS repeat-associated core domain-containing protein n=1 Tax=Chryseobacterium polytrichastri TaxID=1302687 RepID=A0A1M6TAA3_9FLAO|nr:RHS repeat-associated core domain-containing protein [Chryseobacterium polytrichastri]SHK53897.1 RHS repeat-associated core domain-containing protein [Chryseobacterium polytrichastri]